MHFKKLDLMTLTLCQQPGMGSPSCPCREGEQQGSVNNVNKIKMKNTHSKLFVYHLYMSLLTVTTDLRKACIKYGLVTKSTHKTEFERRKGRRNDMFEKKIATAGAWVVMQEEEEGGRDTVPQDRGPQGRKEEEVEGKRGLPPQADL